MKSKRTLIVNFNKKGGIFQFSDELKLALKLSGIEFDYIEAPELLTLIKKLLNSDEVIFTSNNKVIYFLIMFFTKNSYKLILHDHKLREGASYREIVSFKLFLLFQSRFSRIIVHDKSTELLQKENVTYLKMPLHGHTPNASQKIRLLAFGRIDKYKNIDLLVRGCASLANVELTIAGSGYVDESIKTIIAKSPNITIINQYIDDFFRDQLFLMNDYIVTTYNSVTQTGILDLACYFSKPQIISDIPGFQEYKSYKTAIFVNINDEDDFRLTLKHLPSREEYNYSKLVDNCHSITKNQKKLWSKYASVVSND